jgi:hypothetical protein
MRENLEVTMNMVKNLLLGAAAAIVATTGAQAADLPVKAKPVEYVKICSAYGAGFYYIPGTDVCLRVGGYIFTDFQVNLLGPASNDQSGQIGGDFVHSRRDDSNNFRVRNDIIFDARTNTEYGTLRSYASIGWQWTTNPFGASQNQIDAGAGGNYGWYYDRAFIQFAGLTFGYVGSFYDFDPGMTITFLQTRSQKFTPAIAYTAQFGNGISASVSMEDSTTRRTKITNAAYVAGTDVNGAAFAAPLAANFYAGQSMPDFVANLRVDQAWGDAQVSGAVHQLRDQNQANSATGAQPIAGTRTLGTAGLSSKYGYAALAGINIKLPALGAGDSFQIEGSWTKGAVDYTGMSGSPYTNRTAIGYRWGSVGPVINIFDSFVDATGGQHLSKAWDVNAQLRHLLTPTIRSTVMYGYLKYSPDAVATGAGNPSGKIQQAGVNLIWSPVPKLDLGVEGIWTRIEDDCANLTAAACATDQTRGRSVDFWGGVFRARRDF